MNFVFVNRNLYVLGLYIDGERIRTRSCLLQRYFGKVQAVAGHELAHDESWRKRDSGTPFGISETSLQSESRIAVLCTMRSISFPQRRHTIDTVSSLLCFEIWKTNVQRAKTTYHHTPQNVCIYAYSFLGPQWTPDTCSWFGSYGPQQ